MDLKSWAEIEEQKVEELKQKVFSEKGFKPFYTMPVGATDITIDTSIEPRITEKYPDRVVFRILVNGEEYDWSINTKSKAYLEFVKLLKAGHESIRVVRTGTGRDSTKYSFIPLD